jgi:hypothetical protein
LFLSISGFEIPDFVKKNLNRAGFKGLKVHRFTVKEPRKK